MIEQKNSETLWSARIILNRQLNWKEHLRNLVTTTPSIKYFGFTTGENTQARTYTFTKYPREKYGIQEEPELFRSLEIVTTSLLRAGFSPTVVLEHERSTFDKMIRVVFGRNNGYDSNTLVDMSTYEEELPNARINQGEILSVYSTEGKTQVYTEPAAIIWGTLVDFPSIGQLAVKLFQERFTLENFENGTTILYETEFANKS